ncbi:reverse transcriptase [Phytophthora megakarya]|uniref:Reverse transcriptase n=1 Tax=Phytophthora megakarya TaxID=4795 RepID=A0A225W3E4_9STRA|nr:reverse transcriptase [Phytophthora megakarya]
MSQLKDQLVMLPDLDDLSPECDIEAADVGEPGESTEAQEKQLESILKRHKKIFLGDGNAAPPPARGVICDLDVGDTRPVAQRPRSVGPHLAIKVYELLKKLLEATLIEHSESPWASPIVIVLKKNGVDIRMCIDYRVVNSFIQLSNYPLPLIDHSQLPKSSRRFYGIVVQKYLQQTLGLSNYKASRHAIAALHGRFDVFEYLDLCLMTAWEEMWRSRITFLVFFPRGMFEDEFYTVVPRVHNFMYKWRREYWERGHWLTISADMDQFMKAEDELMTSQAKIKGYSNIEMFEAGFWVVSMKPCDWILRYPEEGISLEQQMRDIDRMERARTQWATRTSDDCYLDIAPQKIRHRHIKHQKLLLPLPTIAGSL